jgi:hypothetical protein
MKTRVFTEIDQTFSLPALRRFVDRRRQLLGWGYPLFLLPNSFERTLTARRLSVWSIDRPGSRLDLADAAHHVGNMRLLVEKPDSEAVGGRNRFMMRLPRKRLSSGEYQPERDMKSGPPEPIPVKPRSCNWELLMSRLKQAAKPAAPRWRMYFKALARAPICRGLRLRRRSTHRTWFRVNLDELVGWIGYVGLYLTPSVARLNVKQRLPCRVTLVGAAPARTK